MLSGPTSSAANGASAINVIMHTLTGCIQDFFLGGVGGRWEEQPTCYIVHSVHDGARNVVTSTIVWRNAVQ